MKVQKVQRIHLYILIKIETHQINAIGRLQLMDFNIS